MKTDLPQYKQNAAALPNNPADLIRLAVLDIIALHDDERYVVDMGSWHSKFFSDMKCAVCFAGSVMARSLHVPRSVEIDAGDFPVRYANKFYALNNFRAGEVASGFNQIGRRMPSQLQGFINVAPYEDDPAQFIVDMLDLAHSIDEAEKEERRERRNAK